MLAQWVSAAPGSTPTEPIQMSPPRWRQGRCPTQRWDSCPSRSNPFAFRPAQYSLSPQSLLPGNDRPSQAGTLSGNSSSGKPTGRPLDSAQIS